MKNEPWDVDDWIGIIVMGGFMLVFLTPLITIVLLAIVEVIKR